MEDRLGHDVFLGRPLGGTSIALFVENTVESCSAGLYERPLNHSKNQQSIVNKCILNDTLEMITGVFDKFIENIFVCVGDFNYCDTKLNDE